MSTLEPKTRTEQFYDAILSGDTSELPTPCTREEVYLRQIAENGSGGGSSLPEVTTDDDGKVLKVVDGEWDKGTDDGLPEVTSEDNDKIMKVINGAWGKDNREKDIIIYRIEYTNDKYYLMDGATFRDISSQLNKKNNNKYVVLVNVNWRMNYSVSKVFLPIGSGYYVSLTENSIEIYQGLNDLRYLSEIKKISLNNVLPSVSSADNDKILKVVDGEWKAVLPE